MTCSVYTITHVATGRAYVGVSVKPVRRWAQHRHVARSDPKKHLHCALAKHGADAFEWRVLSVHETPEEALAVEVELIASGRFVFNHSSGGERPVLDAAARAKVSARLKGRKYSEETIRRMSEGQINRYAAGAAHPRLGAHLSASSRAEISTKLKAHYARPGSKRHLAERAVSSETRAKMSHAAKRRFARDGHPRQGVKHAPETKAKMAKSRNPSKECPQ